MTIKENLRVLAILISLAMVFTMMPSAAYGATWGNGNTEEERNSSVVVDYEPIPNYWLPGYANPQWHNTINFKAGELQAFTFYNAFEEMGAGTLDRNNYRNPYRLKLTEANKEEGNKETLAKSQLKDWSCIATKIFSSQSEIGESDGSSAVTWCRPTNLDGSWSDFFEKTEAADSVLGINLPDWLCLEAEAEEEREDREVHTTAHASGFQSADSLSALRNSLISAVADFTEADSGQLENRDNKQGKTLSALDDATSRDVYYSYVLWRGNDGSTECYNCYGIALYDFQYIPIEGDGLRYSAQSEQYDDNEGGNRVVSSLSPLVNEESSEKRMDITLEGQKSQTQQNVMGEMEQRECSYAYADRFAEAFKNTWPVGYSDVKGLGNFHSILATTREEGEKVVYRTSDKRTLNPIVPAHSLLRVNEMKDAYRYDMFYDAASSLRYKLSIFSLSGSIDEAGEVSDLGDFCTEFGAEGSISANDDANSNLYERAVKQARSDEALARTEGYYKGERLSDAVDWTHPAFTENVVLGEESHPVKDVIQERATRLPMAEVFMVLYLITTIEQQELGATVPLYYLSQFDLSDGLRSEYPMLAGSSYPIDALSVVGKNAYDVVYSGFNAKTDQKLGSWKVATVDPEGQALESGVVTISEDANTGKQKIQAKKAGTAYLTWELKDKTEDGKAIKFSSNDGKTVSAREKTPQYPYVKIRVMDATAVPDKILFDSNLPNSISVIAGESINLHSALPTKVLDENEEVIDHSCVYKFENGKTTETDASIDEYGNFIAHKPGDYRIKAEYYGENEHGTPMMTTTPVENKTVKVLDARKLTLVPVGGIGKIDPKEDGAFGLNGCLTYEDQYGEPWTGDVPELKFTLIGSAKCGNDPDEVSKKAKIWGDQLVVDHRNIGDGDIFHIKAEAKGAPNVEAVSFDYALELIPSADSPKADIPRAVSGLVFNGKAQNGVKSGKGYTLKGEKAVNAGWHEATATLDSQYRCWSDGSTAPVRTVRYYIDKAANPLKLKGKSATVKYKKLKKKTQTLSRGKAISVTAPQGKLTYKKVSVSYSKAKSVKLPKKLLKKYKKKLAKKISVNAKTGKLTVKKGLKKGTYKVKIKVKAAGNANYKPSAWKTVTVKIKIK